MPRQNTFRQPDDFHLHLREGKLLQAVLPYSARTFARALVMPNLEKPILNAQQAQGYKKRICQVLDNPQLSSSSSPQPPSSSSPQPPLPTFHPLMTLFLTEETSIEDFWLDESECTLPPVLRAVFAGKLYFASATTNAKHGVRDLPRLFPLFERMEKHNFPLSIHGEVADETTDIFDREAVFIDRHLQPLVERFPSLRITFEHISTQRAVDFVREKAAQQIPLAATVTPHHLLLNRNALLAGGLRPHHYCLPLVKREEDRLALVEIVRSGEKNFFLGTDSAPHARADKQDSCGCAGIFNAPYAVECVFAACNPTTPAEMRCLEQFASENGAIFHNLPLNEARLTLVERKEPYRTQYRTRLPIPDTEEDIVVFTPPQSLQAGSPCRFLGITQWQKSDAA